MILDFQGVNMGLVGVRLYHIVQFHVQELKVRNKRWILGSFFCGLFYYSAPDYVVYSKFVTSRKGYIKNLEEKNRVLEKERGKQKNETDPNHIPQGTIQTQKSLKVILHLLQLNMVCLIEYHSLG